MGFAVITVLAVIGIVIGIALKKSGNRHGSLVAGLFLMLLAIIALARCAVIVDAGNVGVVNRFGTVSPEPLLAGIHLVDPFATVEMMSIKTQEIKEDLDVPSKEGLKVGLEASLIYHLDPAKAPDIFRTVGRNYPAVLIEPLFRSSARGVTASFDAKALYTSERELLADRMKADLQSALAGRGIIVESTPLRKVELPEELQAAIVSKLKADQSAQAMEFQLILAKKEAERRVIEAQGIADSQKVITAGLTPDLLKWKGLEVTEKLANSPNTKVIVIGNPGMGGLPIILGDSK